MSPKVRVAGFLSESRHVLLAKHLGHSFWTFVGGSWERGESIWEGVEREFLEETGMVVETGALLFVGDFRSEDEQHVLDLVFRVSRPSAAPAINRALTGKTIAIEWISVDELHSIRLEPKPFWEVWVPALRSDTIPSHVVIGDYGSDGIGVRRQRGERM